MDLRRGHDHGLLMHIYHKLGLWVPMAAGRVRGLLGPAETAAQSQLAFTPDRSRYYLQPLLFLLPLLGPEAHSQDDWRF